MINRLARDAALTEVRGADLLIMKHTGLPSRVTPVIRRSTQRTALTATGDIERSIMKLAGRAATVW